MDEVIAEKFWSRVQPTGFCWEWTGSLDRGGYGQFSPRHGYCWKAHRVSYQLLVGPIPSPLVIDHLCRNRACVNPDHLEPVTRKENTLRGYGPGRMNRDKTQCPRGHALSGHNLYVDPRGRRNCKDCQRAAVRRYKAKGRS